MNWYPTIYHPITKQPINLFSEEINQLLEQGFTEQDLLTQPRVIGTTVLTGISDVDYEMMMYLDYDQLKNICSLNQYGAQLCQNKQFWLRKFKYEQLLLPTLPLNGNWLKLYGILNNITIYMLAGDETDKSVAILNPVEKISPTNDKTLDISHPSEKLLDFLVKYNFVDNNFRQDYNFLHSIVFWKHEPMRYYVDFRRKNLAGISTIDLYLINQQKLVDFLYEAMMSNIIIKLTEE